MRFIEEVGEDRGLLLASVQPFCVSQLLARRRHVVALGPKEYFFRSPQVMKLFVTIYPEGYEPTGTGDTTATHSQHHQGHGADAERVVRIDGKRHGHL
jgi:hypothetical protein